MRLKKFSFRLGGFFAVTMHYKVFIIGSCYGTIKNYFLHSDYLKHDYQLCVS